MGFTESLLGLLSGLFGHQRLPESIFEVLFGFELVSFEDEGDDEEEDEDDTEKTNVPEKSEGEYFVVGGGHPEFVLVWQVNESHFVFDRIYFSKSYKIIYIYNFIFLTFNSFFIIFFHLFIAFTFKKLDYQFKCPLIYRILPLIWFVYW